jgi:hypothetical protein
MQHLTSDAFACIVRTPYGCAHALSANGNPPHETRCAPVFIARDMMMTVVWVKVGQAFETDGKGVGNVTF